MLDLIEAGDVKGLCFFITVRTIIILICWAFMVLSCLIDLWSGRNAARFLGEALESHKYRRTIVKIGDYAKVMLFGFMFDILGMLLPFYILPFGSMLCSFGEILIEGKSVIENSAKKKAHAAELPNIISDIIKAATAKDAEQIIKKLKTENNG